MQPTIYDRNDSHENEYNQIIKSISTTYIQNDMAQGESTGVGAEKKTFGYVCISSTSTTGTLII